MRDEKVAISNKQMACKLLRRASLAPEKMSQVLVDCGYLLDPGRTETVLHVMLSKIHESE